MGYTAENFRVSAVLALKAASSVLKPINDGGSVTQGEAKVYVEAAQQHVAIAKEYRELAALVEGT